MKLNVETLQNKAFWAENNVVLPRFDPRAVADRTAQQPTWVHFGAGNIFRAFIAVLQQRLLEQELADTGIVVAETFDHEIIEKIYAPHDNLGLLVTLRPDGTTKREIVAGVGEAVAVDPQGGPGRDRLSAVFASDTLQMASFTITEKGYAVRGLDGALLPIVARDAQGGPDKAGHVMSLVTAMLFYRYQAGGAPVALVSMDNCSHNGDKVKQAVFTVAELWRDNGFVPQAFIDYLTAKVSFPWSMIDKITPRPDGGVQDGLLADGFEDMQTLVTGKSTYIAPFVNAEEPQYLVVEDAFPAGRPPLEKAGVLFTDRDTVDKAERMKVTTCLNPLHTALAVFGCLIGYDLIADEMKDADLKRLAETIGNKEGLPVVIDPKILDPRQFLKEVLVVRLPNPFMPDTPQRIATDTSQKVAIRFGETIKAYVKQGKQQTLTAIPLVLAGWLRYLLAVDDKGAPMTLSPDPLLEELRAKLTGIRLGDPASYTGQLAGILTNKTLFGLDLAEAGLAPQVERLFKELIAGPGAVRATLRRVVSE